jgi:hypothetical protein
VGTGRLTEGRPLTTADQAGTTALRGTIEDLGYRFKFVFDRLGAAPDAGRILDFARAAQAAARLRGARIGMMGCRDMHLYGTRVRGLAGPP